MDKDWPLSIDRSFWEDWAFVKWQALRRNARYRREVGRLYKESPDLFNTSEIAHLLQNYPLPDYSNRYAAWKYWAINQAGTRPRGSTTRKVDERLLALSPTSKRINLWSVPPEVCFPHPYFLDKLRPLPFAIPLEPVNRKSKNPPFTVLAETGLRRPKYLRLDVSLPKETLRRAMVDYLKGLRIVQRQKKRKQILNLRATVQKIMKQIPRRALSLHAADIPYHFAVWDKKERGLTFRKIAETFRKRVKATYPDKAPGIQWAQDNYKAAKRLINSII